MFPFSGSAPMSDHPVSSAMRTLPALNPPSSGGGPSAKAEPRHLPSTAPSAALSAVSASPSSASSPLPPSSSSTTGAPPPGLPPHFVISKPGMLALSKPSPLSKQGSQPTPHSPSPMGLASRTSEELEDFGTSFLVGLKTGERSWGQPVCPSRTIGQFNPSVDTHPPLESASSTRSISLPSISGNSQSRPFFPDTRWCQFCGVFDTPMWRRGPAGRGTLCNACGIRWSQKNKQSSMITSSTVVHPSPLSVVKNKKIPGPPASVPKPASLHPQLSPASQALPFSSLQPRSPAGSSSASASPVQPSSSSSSALGASFLSMQHHQHQPQQQPHPSQQLHSHPHPHPHSHPHPHPHPHPHHQQQQPHHQQSSASSTSTSSTSSHKSLKRHRPNADKPSKPSSGSSLADLADPLRPRGSESSGSSSGSTSDSDSSDSLDSDSDSSSVSSSSLSSSSSSSLSLSDDETPMSFPNTLISASRSSGGGGGSSSSSSSSGSSKKRDKSRKRRSKKRPSRSSGSSSHSSRSSKSSSSSTSSHKSSSHSSHSHGAAGSHMLPPPPVPVLPPPKEALGGSPGLYHDMPHSINPFTDLRVPRREYERPLSDMTQLRPSISDDQMLHDMLFRLRSVVQMRQSEWSWSTTQYQTLLLDAFQEAEMMHRSRLDSDPNVKGHAALQHLLSKTIGNLQELGRSFH